MSTSVVVLVLGILFFALLVLGIIFTVRYFIRKLSYKRQQQREFNKMNIDDL